MLKCFTTKLSVKSFTAHAHVFILKGQNSFFEKNIEFAICKTPGLFVTATFSTLV
jgi:hypothetical protein